MRAMVAGQCVSSCQCVVAPERMARFLAPHAGIKARECTSRSAYPNCKVPCRSRCNSSSLHALAIKLGQILKGNHPRPSQLDSSLLLEDPP